MQVGRSGGPCSWALSLGDLAGSMSPTFTPRKVLLSPLQSSAQT